MKNKVIIIVVIVLALAAGGGYMAYNNWYNSTEHQVELAEEMIVNGNHEEALATYEMLVTREPENVGFAQKVCDEKIALGKHNAAVVDLKALLAIDKTNLTNWTNLISESEAAGIDALDLGALYVEAYDATQNAAFDAWIQEHQPVMPEFSLASGEYTNLNQVKVTGKDFDMEVTLDGEEIKPVFVQGNLGLKHGKNVIKVVKTSPWGFTQAATYEYDVNNIVTFKSEKFGQLFRSITGMDEVRYEDLNKYVELTLIGDHLYLADKSHKSFGENITSYMNNGSEYGNAKNGTWYRGIGSIATSEDIALFPNLEFLAVGKQANGFAQGLKDLNTSKLRAIRVFDQNDFTQELFVEKLGGLQQLGFVSLFNTQVNDINLLAKMSSMYQVSLTTKIKVNFDEVEANADIRFSVKYQ